MSEHAQNMTKYQKISVQTKVPKFSTF